MRRCLISLSYLAASFGFVVANAVAHELGPHVHGVANLLVAAEGSTLTLTLESPLANFLGFEHVPRSTKQREALRGVVERLNQSALMFSPSIAAKCHFLSVKLESQVLEPHGKPLQQSEASAHADLDATYVFRCDRADALRDLEVRAFDIFPGLKQLDVQIVSPYGQSSARLSAKQRRVNW